MQTILIISIIVFLIFFILLERLSSIKFLIRWLLSLIIIYGYVKVIADGKDIVLFSIILVIMLSIVNIYIKSGIHKKSLSEVISVVITTFLTSAVIWKICSILNLKIFQDAIMKFDGIKKPENAIFGVSMIATSGVFMDLISKINLDLDDKKDKTVDITFKEQFKDGIEIGKKIFNEKINMVILILLGISLFQICSNINNNMNFGEILEQVTVFPYILIAIITNIGIILSIPITSCIYACFNRKKTVYKKSSENRVNGKRSLKL